LGFVARLGLRPSWSADPRLSPLFEVAARQGAYQLHLAEDRLSGEHPLQLNGLS